MAHRKAYIPTVRCAVCNAPGKGLGRWRRWLARDSGEAPRWTCPAHRDLRPGQWDGARALLAAQGRVVPSGAEKAARTRRQRGQPA